MQTRARVTRAVIVGGLALALAGCGTAHPGGPAPSGGASPDPASLDAAASFSAKVTSMSFDVTIKANSSTIVETGSLALSNPLRARLKITIAGTAIEELLLGPTAYLKFPPLTAKTGKTWAKVSLATVGAKMGLDLTALLAQVKQQGPTLPVQLAITSGQVKPVGTEVVGGVSTTHYRGTVDIARSLDRFPADLKAQMQALIDKAAVKNVVLDLWVGPNSRPVRASESYDSKVGPVSVLTTYRDFNQPVDATAPPAADTVDLEKLLGG